MRIVVTGGAGFIGSHLCEKLLGLGHTVYCLDNLSTGSFNNIAALEKHVHFQFRNHDVTEPFDVEGAVDAVVHLASPASPCDFARMPIETLSAGSAGTRNALELAKEKQARFLLSSSSEVYGDPNVHPQDEDYWGNVNPVGPRSPYDEAKRFSEALAVAYRRRFGLDARIARVFNTYGPRMRPSDGRVIPNFIGQALRNEDLTIFGTGDQTRSFCYVSDMIEALARLLLADAKPADAGDCPRPSRLDGPLNLGNPHETKIIDLARTVIALTGSKSQLAWKPLPADDPKLRCPDIKRANQLLGWHPQVTLAEGLKATIGYFRSSGIRSA
jgi:dTDP-glucose 4,6-dehydratase